MDKDIKQYLHYYLGCEIDTGTGYVTLIAVQKEVIPCADFRVIVLNGNVTHELHWDDKCKLVLRKLESMTEQEATEFVNIGVLDKGRKFREITEYAVHFFDRGSYGAIEFGTLHPQHFHYLLSKAFDLFNLIESGAAINKEQQ